MSEELEKEKIDIELTEATEEPAPEELPAVSDEFEVMELIGSGGMGQVYKARNKELDEIVAIKILKGKLSKDKVALKRFEQEAKAAAKLSHANIVSTYSYGTTVDGAPYMVLQYFEGKSLADILKDEGELASERIIKLLMPVCEAIIHAHEHDVIHRDIKPKNIIVTKNEDGTEVAKIVDFGIAKVLESQDRKTHNLTETGDVFGSPNYMSPEQCLGFMLDKRSDIYSLGCMMYELITGEPPFSGSNPVQVVVKHINEEIEPFSRKVKKNKQITKLEGVVFKCLEKDQTNRYQAVQDVLADLEKVSKGQEPSRYERSIKPKHEFTKRQVIGTCVALVAFTFYALVSSALFQSFQLTFVIIYIVGNLMVLAGLYACIGAVQQQLKLIENWRSTSNSWWTILLSFNFGLICLSVLPLTLVLGGHGLLQALEVIPRDANSFYKSFEELVYWELLLHIFALGGSFVSLIGYILFRNKRKVSIGKIIAQFLGITLCLIMSCEFVFPNQASRVVWLTAKAFETKAPSSVTRLLVDISLHLNPENKDAQKLKLLSTGKG